MEAQRGGGGGSGQSIHCGPCCGPPGPAGSSGDAGVGEVCSGGSPSPLKHIPGAAGPVLRGEDRQEGAPRTLAHPGAAGLARLDSCACAMCHGGEGTRAPSPYPCPLCSLKRGIVLVQELPNGPRQLGDFLVGVQVAVDGLPTEMLKSGHVGGEGPAQHQRDLLAPRVDVIGSPGGVPGERLGRWLLGHLRGGRGGGFSGGLGERFSGSHLRANPADCPPPAGWPGPLSLSPL